MRTHVRWAMAAVCLALLGCSGGGTKTSLVYTLPALYKVDPMVKEVAVVKFKALQRTEDTYGEVATSKLNEQLIESGRYKVYDRRNLERVMEERDFEKLDVAAAKVREKIPGLDALITGSIDAGGSLQEETKTQYNILTRQSETVTVKYLTCEATLSFTMINVSNGAVIATTSEIAKYDSRKSGMGAAMLGMLGVRDGGKVGTPQSKLPELIQECVVRFIAKVAPHKVQAQVKLEGGKSNAVGTGNKFAKAGEWGEAERFYRQAVAADAEDYGAHYNLGVALEAQGKLNDAAAEYRTAIGIKDNQEFINSLARVRRLGAE